MPWSELRLKFLKGAGGLGSLCSFTTDPDKEGGIKPEYLLKGQLLLSWERKVIHQNSLPAVVAVPSSWGGAWLNYVFLQY